MPLTIVISCIIFHFSHGRRCWGNCKCRKSCCRAMKAHWCCRWATVRAWEEVHPVSGCWQKKSLLLHFLMFLPYQLSWQTWSWWALHIDVVAMKQLSKGFMLKEFTKILLLLPGLGEEVFTQAAVLAHQWARGDEDKRHPSCRGSIGVRRWHLSITWCC